MTRRKKWQKFEGSTNRESYKTRRQPRHISCAEHGPSREPWPVCSGKTGCLETCNMFAFAGGIRQIKTKKCLGRMVNITK